MDMYKRKIKIKYFNKSLNFFRRMIFYKKGKVLLLSIFLSIPSSVFANVIFEVVLKDTDIKYMVIPTLVQIGMVIIYSIFNFLDFCVGLRSSKNDGKEFDFGKVLDSTIKYVAVIFAGFTFMMTGIIGEIANSKTIWWGSLVCLFIFWFLANFYEFGSIGKHIEEYRGQKYPIFKFFDRVVNSTEKRVIQKIDSFDFLESKKVDEIKKEVNDEI